MIASIVLAAAMAQTPVSPGWEEVSAVYRQTIPAHREVTINHGCYDALHVTRSGAYNILAGRAAIRPVAVFPGNSRTWTFAFYNSSARPVDSAIRLYVMCEPEIRTPAG
jgi:hypothetical protein